MTTALVIVAGILAVIDLVQSKGTSLAAWGLLALAVAVYLVLPG